MLVIPAPTFRAPKELLFFFVGGGARGALFSPGKCGNCFIIMFSKFF